MLAIRKGAQMREILDVFKNDWLSTTLIILNLVFVFTLALSGTFAWLNFIAALVLALTTYWSSPVRKREL